MKTAFFFCTPRSDEKNTSAYTSLSKLSGDFKVLFARNNKTGLSLTYNKILNEHKNTFDNIVFLHDDVYVEDSSVLSKLEKHHNDFDIVGLAGGLNPVIKAPALWHLMCGGFGSGNLRGAVAHPAGNTKIAMTSFGPTPDRVAILDGLFLSVKTNSIGDWKFNENYDFHHYDIASCIDANKAKLKLGVAPIWVVHNSPGLKSFDDKNFTISQEKFLKEYGNI